MILTLCLLLICWFLYVKLRRNSNYWSTRNVRFAQPLPIIGNMLDILLGRKSFGSCMAHLYSKFNEPYFGIWLFNAPVLVIRSPDLIKNILVKDFKYFCDRNISCNEETDELLANMTFYLKNPKWREVRSQTSPMFSSTNLKLLYPQVEEITKNLVKFISDSKEEAIELNDMSIKYSTDAVCASAFGINVHSFQNKDTPFVAITKNFFYKSCIHFMKTLFTVFHDYLFLKLEYITKSTANFLTEFILEVKKQREVSKNCKSIFDFKVKSKEGSQFGHVDIVAQGAQFFVAASESLSSAIALALYELSLNKTMQDKLRTEIYDHLGNDGTIEYEALQGMEYLDKVFQETLRKYAPIPFLGRTCTEEYKVPNTALVIEKGVDVIIPVSGLHYDPKYYPTPEEFDPERFSEENVRKRPPYSYLPFGEGQRNCIGKRMGVMLVKQGIVHIIKSFEIVISNRTRNPLQFDSRMFSLKVNGGIYVEFKKLF